MLKVHSTLTGEERQALSALISKGRTQAYNIRHAHILLKADTLEVCSLLLFNCQNHQSVKDRK